MSVAASVQSTTKSDISLAIRDRNVIFQDLPLIDRTTRLTIIELQNSDKQVVNELVYRFCRILTRASRRSLDGLNVYPSDTAIQDSRRVLIIDLIGCLNPIRLASVLRKDEKRMRMIGICRSCKINSTFVTLCSYLGRPTLLPSTLKLVVIYQDEFFINKSLDLLKDLLDNTRTQVLFVVPKLDRKEQDLLNLITKHQILKCDFCVNRFEIGPAPIDLNSSSYQSYLNKVLFRRYSQDKHLPERVEGELVESGLNLKHPEISKEVGGKTDCDDNNPKRKLAKID